MQTKLRALSFAICIMIDYLVVFAYPEFTATFYSHGLFPLDILFYLVATFKTMYTLCIHICDLNAVFLVSEDADHNPLKLTLK